jgi:phenylalanyl-tRNA synthetase beta chain
MLCALAEIGFGTDMAGIALLDDDVRPGTAIADMEGFEDSVLEIGITPNRSDCLSILGIAREVSALYGLPLNRPYKAVDVIDGKCPVSVTVDAPQFCRRYAGAVIEGVKIGDSPPWLKNRLAASGIRSVNNVVDITNYVMLELGQPMHAFDLSAIEDNQIIVRTAPGESIRTLDGREFILDENMLAICDASKPVAVAGVMGGFDSQVTDETVSIMLESACFAPGQVRKTAKKLKIPSESSYRFERGVDPELAPVALARAVAMVLELAGGKLAGGVDVNVLPWTPLQVGITVDRVNTLIGLSMDADRMKRLLESVGIKTVVTSNGHSLESVVPSWRSDIGEGVDLVEEIARLYGFDKIPARIPVAGIAGLPEDRIVYWSGKIRDILAGFGMAEVISYSFLSEREIASMHFQPDDRRMSVVRIQNPLTEDQAVMRTSIVTSLLSTVSRNMARRNLDLKMFEMGTVFHDNGAEKLPDEEQRLAGIIVGRRYPESWAYPDVKVDFYDLKGVVEGLCASCGIGDRISFRACPAHESWLTPGAALELVLDDKVAVGVLGLVDSAVAKAFDIDGEVFAFDLSMDILAEFATDDRHFVPLNRFPAIELDLAIIVSDHIRSADVIGFIQDNAPPFLESCRIFDVYHGKPIPSGAKSLGIRFTYRDKERTLSEEDVRKGHDEVVKHIMERFKATLRS